MREYYPVLFIIKEKQYYCCWYGDEKDGFLVNSNKLLNFRTLKELKEFASKNNTEIKVEDDVQSISIDQLRLWLSCDNKSINCKVILELWNIIRDISYSLGLTFHGNERKPVLDKIYDKLFWGNNLPVVTPEGKSYLPLWELEEKEEIEKIVQDGIRIIENVL